jgi:hypothetical protein
METPLFGVWRRCTLLALGSKVDSEARLVGGSVRPLGGDLIGSRACIMFSRPPGYKRNEPLWTDQSRVRALLCCNLGHRRTTMMR